MALIYLIIFAVAMVASYFVTAGLTWVVCWAFGLAFSWKLAAGVWAVIALLSGIFKNNSSK